MKRIALLITSFTLAILMTACGGGGGGGGSKTTQPPAPSPAPAPVPTSSAPVTSATASSASTSEVSISSISPSSTPVSSSSLSSAPANVTGVLWHNDYALDYRSGIQLAPLNGSLSAQITTRTDVDVSVWPDGKQYVVTNWDVYDDYTEITVIDRESGSTVYQRTVDGYFRNVSPSPTNKNVVKARLGADSISPFYEFVIDLSNGNVPYEISENDWFAWMPDGRFMLIDYRTGNMRIASLENPEGTQVGQLNVPEDREIGEFSVSPTGEQFIMVMVRKGSTLAEPDLWIGNIDGSGFEQLTDTKIFAGGAWSPDGKYVAYVTDTGSVCGYGGCLGSCDQWYTPTNLRKVQGFKNTPGSEQFLVNDRNGNQQVLGCSVIAWTP